MRLVGLLVLLLMVGGTASHATDEASCLDRCSTDAHAAFVGCRIRGGRLDDCFDAATEASRRCTVRCPSATLPGLRCAVVADEVIRQCMVHIADAVACAQLRDSEHDRCAEEMVDVADAEADGARPACFSDD